MINMNKKLKNKTFPKVEFRMRSNDLHIFEEWRRDNFPKWARGDVIVYLMAKATREKKTPFEKFKNRIIKFLGKQNVKN